MTLTKHLSQQPKRLILTEAYLLMLLLGVADYLTGHDFSFLIFYLLPVLLVSAFVGKVPGVGISVASAGAWFTADLLSRHQYHFGFIPYWNILGVLCNLCILSLSVSMLVETLERERLLARRDDVTGLPNRRCFLEIAHAELMRARRFLRPLTLAYLDIDNFKEVNDTFGHSAGDTLLRTMADLMQAGVRSSDILARLGGDEFAILLPETGTEAALTVIRRMQTQLLELVAERGWPITVTIGVVTCLRLPTAFDDLLHLADDLMYSGKSSGKNTIKYTVLGEELSVLNGASVYATGENRDDA